MGRHRRLHLKARLLEVEFENMAVADAVWHRSLLTLDSLCKISHEDISRIACALTKTNKKAISKGYKFFWATIWKVRVKICSHIYIMVANLSVKCHYSKMCLHRAYSICLSDLSVLSDLSENSHSF